MKKNVLFFIIISFSCHTKVDKQINDIKVNYVSIRMNKKYGQLCKPPFKITETIIKRDEYTILVYKDTVSFKRVDTLKIFNNGEITFDSVKADIVDNKIVNLKNKTMLVKKIHIPHIGNISVDDYGGEIIYFTNKGLIARYALISNYISLYNPDLYSELHDKILYQKIHFKRHKEEMEGYLP